MTPRIAVVIPTYERPEPLGRCLAALAAQTLPREEFQVVVVDDGSAYDPESVVGSFREDLRLDLLRQDHRGPGAARNRGVEAAEAGLIAFTDDDCEPRPDWLEAMRSRLTGEREPCLVGGSIVNLLTDNPFACGTQMVLDMVYEHYNADPDDARFFASMNLGVRKAALIDCGGFSESFRTAEDRELCDRWRHAGHRLVFEPRAQIGHAHHLTFRTFSRQHLGYGRGAAHYHEVRRKRESGTLREESSFHRALPGLVMPHLRRLPVSRSFVQLGVLAQWQVMNLVGYLDGRRSVRRGG